MHLDVVMFPRRWWIGFWWRADWMSHRSLVGIAMVISKARFIENHSEIENFPQENLRGKLPSPHISHVNSPNYFKRMIFALKSIDFSLWIRSSLRRLSSHNYTQFAWLVSFVQCAGQFFLPFFAFYFLLKNYQSNIHSFNGNVLGKSVVNEAKWVRHLRNISGGFVIGRTAHQRYCHC